MIVPNPLTAAGVVIATAATDAVYVMFTSAVVARKRVPAATWSSIWYLLSSYAVISYTENWIYVAFAAAGSWIGAFASITFLHRRPAALPSARRRTKSWFGRLINTGRSSGLHAAMFGEDVVV
jgi:predicted transcriptional regulator